MEKIECNGTTWINIEEVTSQDADYLGKSFDFHPLDLKDCLGAPQRAKTDIYDHYLFIILHFPYLDVANNVLRSSDLNIFITKTHIITVQKRPISFLHDLFLDCKKNTDARMQSFLKSPDLFLYYILDRLYHQSLTIIDELYRYINATEEYIFGQKGRIAVRNIAEARRNNLAMRALLNPQRLVINTLAHIQKDWFNKEGETTLYYDDILDYLEKNWIFLENQKELIEGLNETNQTLLTYKSNAVITILTVFSVAILPLTLLTGLYGMNIPLPFAEEPRVIWLLFLLVASVTLGLIYYILSRKEWI